MCEMVRTRQSDCRLLTPWDLNFISVIFSIAWPSTGSLLSPQGHKRQILSHGVTTRL